MDKGYKLFLDEVLDQLVKLNRNVEYIANEMSRQRARQDIILRKVEVTNDFDKIS